MYAFIQAIWVGWIGVLRGVTLGDTRHKPTLTVAIDLWTFAHTQTHTSDLSHALLSGKNIRVYVKRDAYIIAGQATTRRQRVSLTFTAANRRYAKEKI